MLKTVFESTMEIPDEIGPTVFSVSFPNHVNHAGLKSGQEAKEERKKKQGPVHEWNPLSSINRSLI